MTFYCVAFHAGEREVQIQQGRRRRKGKFVATNYLQNRMMGSGMGQYSAQRVPALSNPASPPPSFCLGRSTLTGCCHRKWLVSLHQTPPNTTKLPLNSTSRLVLQQVPVAPAAARSRSGSNRFLSLHTITLPNRLPDRFAAGNRSAAADD